MIQKIDEINCTGCGICIDVCVPDVLRMDQNSEKVILKYPEDCITCFECELVCPVEAIHVHPLKQCN